MSENEPEKPRKKWGCLQWGVIMMVLVLLAGYFRPTYGLISAKSRQMKAVSNARQIVGLLLTYAADNEDYYPDHDREPKGLTSNVVFRELVKEGLTQDETIFGGLFSRFNPDRNVGTAPEFNQALEPGENHWMMVAGLRNDSPFNHPLILENSVEGSSPPKWLPFPSVWSRGFLKLMQEPPARGRSWEQNRIIMALNDGAVNVVPLEKKDGFLYLPKILKAMGSAPLPQLNLIDIEVAP